jgi:hypothetical protein
VLEFCHFCGTLSGAAKMIDGDAGGDGDTMLLRIQWGGMVEAGVNTSRAHVAQNRIYAVTCGTDTITITFENVQFVVEK